jgi:arylsulfatase A-like enzyme
VSAQAGDESSATGTLGARVDLAKVAGKVVPLTLTARDCARAKVVAPEIRIAGAAAVALPKAEKPTYIVLWIMDALRADKIPVFQPGARAQTPHMAELAKSSVVYRQYYVQGNESQVSHSTMWTSLYPGVHNVRVVGAPGGTGQVGKKFDLIATKLKAAGYRTEAVTANGFVNEWGGYARGFDLYRNMMRERGVINGLIYGEKIVEPALARLEMHKTNPMYLYIGTVDTHGPWVARKPWIDQYSPPDYKGPFVLAGTAAGLGIRPDSMGCHKIPAPADIERMRAIYDSAISYQDQLVGDFIAKLKSWGIWEQTMLVITADHGEEWFEDGRCNHGGSLRDSLVRVPMLVHYPKMFPGGTIVEEGVEAADLFPTLLDVIGVERPAALQGTSMMPLAQGVGRGWPRPSYASMFELSHAMRIGRWKLRVNPRGVPLLNDLVGHPEELTDLTASHLVERRMMTDNLSLFLALRKQWKKGVWGVTTNITTQGATELDRVETP